MELLILEFFNSLTNLTSIQITNQRITLDPYAVGSDGKIILNNPVVDSNRNPVEAINISDNGTYSNGTLTWEKYYRYRKCSRI